jgi:Ser/Thr protein kinase RdoA (MazF antagonist)
MLDTSSYTKLNLSNITCIHDGYDNTVFFATSKVGEVVIRQGKNPSKKSPLFEAMFLKHLQELQMLTPQIIPTDDGSLFSQTQEGVWLTVFKHIPGEPLKNDLNTRREQSHSAGSILAQIHQAGKSFDQKTNQKRTIFSEIDEALDLEIEIKKKFGSEGRSFVKDLYKAQEIFNSKALSKSESILHNDFRPQNLILSTNQTLIPIDFDWATPGPIIKDLSHALLEWGRTDQEESFDTTIMNSFLKGYNLKSSEDISFNQGLKDWMFANAVSDAASFIVYRIAMNKPAPPSKSFMYRKALSIKQI